MDYNFRELVLIHPFREGNGRLARMLAILTAAQAGYPALDFSHLTGPKKKKYFQAVAKGMDYRYEPMEDIFSDVIEQTMRIAYSP